MESIRAQGTRAQNVHTSQTGSANAKANGAFLDTGSERANRAIEAYEQGYRAGLNACEGERVRARIADLPDPMEAGVRSYLKAVRDTARRLDILKLDMDLYRRLAVEACGTTDLLGCARFSGDPSIEKRVLRFIEQRAAVAAECERLAAQVEQAAALIDTLPTPELAEVLRLRYLHGLPWKEIRAKLHCCDSWARRLEGTAIERLESAGRQ